MHPEFAPVAFISAIAVLVVLPWHWRAGNIATLALAGWLFITNIIYAVDAVIWGDNAIIIAPVWCDITTKLIIGSSFGLPAACLCICIHLERLASVRSTTATHSDKRNRQIFEASMTFGLPVFFMALHFVVQGHRFDIIEEYGCRPTTYFSIPSIFIVWLPPLIMAIASLVYGGLALRHFMVRRLSFAAHLNASQSALTTSRYLRLMLMAALQMVWGVSTTAYALWFTVIAVPIRPWTTWDDVHSDFSRIDQYPKLLTPKNIRTSYYILWWIVPISTLIFVAFFAFGRDAMEEYKKCFLWFRTRILRRVSPTKSGYFDMLKSRFTKSQPTPSSKDTTVSTVSPLPSYVVPPSPSSSCAKNDVAHYDKESPENTSRYHSQIINLYSSDNRSVSSFTELSTPLSSPSIIACALPSPKSPGSHTLRTPPPPPSPPSYISPLPPPPRHPRLREFLLSQNGPSSPRPITYPSLDASHRAINDSH